MPVFDDRRLSVGKRTADLQVHAHGVPATVLGVTGGDALVVDGSFEVPLGELARVWEGTLPALFG